MAHLSPQRQLTLRLATLRETGLRPYDTTLRPGEAPLKVVPRQFVLAVAREVARQKGRHGQGYMRMGGAD